MSDLQDNPMLGSTSHESKQNQNWDPIAVLNNLSFLETKIHHLQDLVHVIVESRGQVTNHPNEIFVQQQHLITADLTSIIVQLISTAGGLLPFVKQNVSNPIGQTSQYSEEIVVNPLGQFGVPTDPSILTSQTVHYVSDQEMKSDDDHDEVDPLPPGSYEIHQLEKEEILAPHTHFCTICGKGFKRDANLRMHMRGHGDEYKTPSALAKPEKELNSDPILMKRYSCPYNGCKRNKDHKKFQPLKSILCVKNHYKRTHCEKMYTCSRCNNKKFSVVADLKTHEKHCGRDKWLCSCGTTFSRKDKLFGHIALFQGHTPAIPVVEEESSRGQFGHFVDSTAIGSFVNVTDVKGGEVADGLSCFSPLSFDSSSIMGGFDEFRRPPFENSESSFSFLLNGYPTKDDEE